MARLSKVIDAPVDLIVPVSEEDQKASMEKTEGSCGAEERTWGCSIEIAGLRCYPQFRAFRVDGTVARAQWIDESIPDWRWILEKDGQKITVLNDLAREALANLTWPIMIRLVSPIATILNEYGEVKTKRPTRSLKWGRSPEGRLAKRESAERRSGATTRGSYTISGNKGRDGRGMTGFYVRKKPKE